MNRYFNIMIVLRLIKIVQSFSTISTHNEQNILNDIIFVLPHKKVKRVQSQLRAVGYAAKTNDFHSNSEINDVFSSIFDKNGSPLQNQHQIVTLNECFGFVRTTCCFFDQRCCNFVCSHTQQDENSPC